MKSFSGSEIEALGMKAARGAGFHWGLAEEAGLAARLLAEAGFDGPAWLLAWLAGPRGATPRIAGRHWRGSVGEILCPIASGAALSDHVGLANGPSEAPLHLHRLGQPALILPLLARAARRGGNCFRVCWDGTEVQVSAARIVAQRADGIATLCAELVTIDSTFEETSEPLSGCSVRAVAPEVWRGLEALALLTTVPASAESRANAGATEDDGT